MISVNKRIFTVVVTGFLGILLLGGTARSYAAIEASKERLRSVSGEIAYVDEKVGELRLEGEETRSRRYPTEFRINREATIVTDPQDQKFLGIKDLKVGQHVAVEFNWVQGKWREPTTALKIVAFPMDEIIYGEITGELEAINVRDGVLIVEEQYLPEGKGRSNLVYFVFDPRYIVAMRAPSEKPVELVLTPGDIVKVDYWIGDGQRHARSVTLLSQGQVSTRTTTTTTRTTVTN